MLYSIAAVRRAVVCPVAAKTLRAIRFLGSGADIGPPVETLDNAAPTLRRLHDAATTIMPPPEEKSRMLYLGHMR
jgi:hypothetical protein